LPRFKVGIIGTGMAFEKLHYPAYQRLEDCYQISALCDVDKEKALYWAKKLQLPAEQVYADYEEMLEKEQLDVVDIMVPIELNFQITEAAARRLAGKGKGIICEKPLAPNLEEAEEARLLPEKYGIPIMIAENYRYNQEVNIIRDLIQTGKIGQVYYFLQNRVVNFPEDRWRNQFPAREWRQYPAYMGGALADIALHDLAALRHIFGAIHKLQSFGRPQEASYSPYSVVQVNLQFANGIIGHFSFFCAGKEMQRPLTGLRIFGTEGMIYLEERDAGMINLAWNNGQREKIPYQPQQGYYNELLNFYRALTGEEPVSVTPEMELGDLKTVHCILQSIAEEKVVPVDEKAVFQLDYGRPLVHGEDRTFLH
jgi:predicted dehydrogenase